MSAFVLVHSGRAAAYGAEELKRAAHKYGFAALAISVMIHFSVIALYYIVPSIEENQSSHILPLPPIVINTPPSMTSIYSPPPKLDHAGARPRSHDGVPVPVPVVDAPVVVEKKIDSGPGLVDDTGQGGTDVPSGDYPPGEPPIDDSRPQEGWTLLEKEPIVVRSVPPVYPELARKAGIEGRVFVKIWVDKQGKAREVAILRSDYEIFNEAALEAARKFLFTPAYMNNGPVSVWVSVPFTFKLAGK